MQSMDVSDRVAKFNADVDKIRFQVDVVSKSASNTAREFIDLRRKCDSAHESQMSADNLHIELSDHNVRVNDQRKQLDYNLHLLGDYDVRLKELSTASTNRHNDCLGRINRLRQDTNKLLGR